MRDLYVVLSKPSLLGLISHFSEWLLRLASPWASSQHERWRLAKEPLTHDLGGNANEQKKSIVAACLLGVLLVGSAPYIMRPSSSSPLEEGW